MLIAFKSLGGLEDHMRLTEACRKCSIDVHPDDDDAVTAACS